MGLAELPVVVDDAVAAMLLMDEERDSSVAEEDELRSRIGALVFGKIQLRLSAARVGGVCSS